MRRRVFAIVAALVILALIGWSVWRRLSARPAAVGAPIPAPVVAAVASRGPIERTLQYAGSLEPRATVTVTPKAAGRIERIFVSEGQAVAKGQLLAQMEQEVASLQAEQASAALRAAEAQLEMAKRGVRPEELENAKASLAQAEKDLSTAEENFNRSDRLYKEGTIAKAKYEDADRQYRAAETALENARRNVQMMAQGAGTEEQSMAEAQVKAARAQYDLARLALDETRIVAPIAGVAARVPADQGNLAGPSTPLVILTSETAMVVKAPVPERWYGLFRQARDRISARVSFAALPEPANFPGRLISISPTIDPASRTFTAEVEVSDPRRELAAGMYAAVDFVIEKATEALLVPATALVSRGGAEGVFVVDAPSPDAQVARFKPVRIGIESGPVVQVIEGIEAGAWVIVEGNAFLDDGQLVRTGD